MSLTDEDKHWIVETLNEKLSHVQKDFNEKLDHVGQDFNEKLDHVGQDFNEKLSHVGQDFNEKLEGMETRLLTAFHGWASPVVARQQSHTAVLRALDLEVEDLKKRVEKLEKPAA
jgi:hypothetical protein